MKSNLYNAIGKYSLLLVVFYFIEVFVIKQIANLAINKLNLDASVYSLFSSALTFLSIFLLNVITVVVILKDKRKMNVATRLVVLTTLVYRLVGVVAFLLFIVNRDISSLKSQDD